MCFLLCLAFDFCNITIYCVTVVSCHDLMACLQTVMHTASKYYLVPVRAWLLDVPVLLVQILQNYAVNILGVPRTNTVAQSACHACADVARLGRRVVSSCCWTHKPSRAFLWNCPLQVPASPLLVPCCCPALPCSALPCPASPCPALPCPAARTCLALLDPAMPLVLKRTSLTLFT